MFLSSFFTSAGMDESPSAYLFKWPHFLYLALVAAGFIILLRLFLHRSARTRRIFIIILAVILFLFKYAGEVLYVWEWNHYGSAISSFSHPFLDVRTFISFQLCGINNVLLPIVVIFNIKWLKDFVYTTSIIGGLAAILYPVGILFGDPFVVTFPMVRTLSVHFLLLFIPCFLIASGDFTLVVKNWWKTIPAGCVIMYLWAMFGNLVIDPGANNMYLMENPFLGGNIPILNSIPSGIHVLVLLFMVFLGFVIVYTSVNAYTKRYVGKAKT